MGKSPSIRRIVDDITGEESYIPSGPTESQKKNGSRKTETVKPKIATKKK